MGGQIPRKESEKLLKCFKSGRCRQYTTHTVKSYSNIQNIDACEILKMDYQQNSILILKMLNLKEII